MTTPISAMMTACVETVGMEDFVAQVETAMSAHQLSSMPVVDDAGRIFGIISAADVMHFHALKRNPKAVHAWEICTHKAIMVDMDASARDVAALMAQNHIHHVVITDAGTIKGIVSSLDFVRQFLMEAE